MAGKSHSKLLCALATIAMANGVATWAVAQNSRPYLRSMDSPDVNDASPDVAPSPPSWQEESPQQRAPSPPTNPQPKSSTTPSRGAVLGRENIPAPVDRGDLSPIIADDGSGLPMNLWQGLNLAQVEKLLGGLSIPPRSATLHDLWHRLFLSRAAPDGSNMAFTAVRIEALYRSGLVADELLPTSTTDDPVLATLSARHELANARRDKACQLARDVNLLKSALPKRVKAEAVLLNGYCAAAAGDTAGAGLAAELAREEGQEQSLGLAALDALSIAAKPNVKFDGRLSLLDYRLLEIAGATPNLAPSQKAEPALLVSLASDGATPRDLRLAAAEAAASLNALPPEALAAIYTAVGNVTLADAALGSDHQPQQQTSSPARRAALFKAMEAQRTPALKARVIETFIEETRRAGLGFQAMRLVARAASQIKPQPALAHFIDTAAAIALASRNFPMLADWVALAPQTSGHWLALADIADPKPQTRGQHLATLQPLALRGRLKPETLHRLATVLEALDYLVPIPLWEAANRTPQPTGGYLPETGVLPDLQQASARKEYAHTILLAMKTLGPDGPEAANLIALGDSIRALKRAGLEAEARSLGLEALLAAWPRSMANERS